MFDGLSKLQIELSGKVVYSDNFSSVCLIGGMDISCNLYSKRLFGCCSLFSYPELIQLAEGLEEHNTPYPYVPGFLGFREAPALVGAYNKLAQKPDLILVDGHGISHPRGLGIATHVGVLLDIPTIGVAKSLLVGERVGDDIIYKGKKIAKALITKKGANPLYISTGHRVSLSSAVEIVLSCLSKLKSPLPIQAAHKGANLFRKLSLQPPLKL